MHPILTLNAPHANAPHGGYSFIAAKNHPIPPRERQVKNKAERGSD
jgi:hypothetical protein